MTAITTILHLLTTAPFWADALLWAALLLLPALGGSSRSAAASSISRWKA